MITRPVPSFAHLTCAVLLLLAVTACSPPPAVTDWRLVIRLPDADVPVRLHLTPDGSEAWFQNGAERVQVPDVSREGARWTLRFPTFNNTIELRQADERLEGELTLVKRGEVQVMPVEGMPDPGYRVVQSADPDVDVTGRWAVTFTDDDGEITQAVGEFDQQGARLTGTFLTPTGDYRFLAGEVDGRKLHLSTFDGAHAFAFSAEVLEDGRLRGDFWSGTKWHETWVANRDFDAVLPDAFSMNHIRDGWDGLAFTFPNLAGEPVSLNDGKYRDKVVLVNLSGTWCPNCADEAEFLARYYERNRERGLEIITLLYEHFEDFERAARQGRALVDKHDIGYDVLVAGSSDKEKAAETLPMLDSVIAFPTLIFVDREGEVRAIHTGFAGPGTGSHYQAFVETFERKMEVLLDE